MSESPYWTSKLPLLEEETVQLSPRWRSWSGERSQLQLRSVLEYGSLACSRVKLKRLLRHFALYLLGLFTVFTVASLLLAILYPAYTSPPPHYLRLEEAVRSSSAPGRANTNNEQVFIAANIVNPSLIDGAWGQSLRKLVDLLGPDNVFVSIYENDSGPDSVAALTALDDSLKCNRSVVTGAHLDMNSMPLVIHPGNPHKKGTKRIEYLSQVRNQALKPFYDNVVRVPNGDRMLRQSFDRVLFLNDVYFNPMDAAQLLFSTRAESGRANYEAACAVDFVSTTNFYDSYATRDFDGFGLGYGAGFRVFPWFARKGSGRSRSAVLAGSDAVPVRSCWGGMTAFNARWFQKHDQSGPIRFRSINEPFWDASECCLIHADISARFAKQRSDRDDHGIFINPYLRVAYDEKTFRRLPTVRRFERGFVLLQDLLTRLSSYPYDAERRLDIADRPERHKVWMDENSPRFTPRIGKHYTEIVEDADPGGFCGMREMAIMKEDLVRAHETGERTYTYYEAPDHLGKSL